MQIIIPMSGFGERFRRAGYHLPKPLIELEGKPIIAHGHDLFPGEKDFLLICNQDHLNQTEYQMEAILRRFCPTGRLIGIAPHKLGPVHAVLQAETLIDLDQPTIVNYCDFTCLWDWSHFQHFVQEKSCAGAIVAYKGFHPHSLGTTNYAYLRETHGWVHDIQEKKPFTNDRMQEFTSSGTYYFASGQLMLKAFHQMVKQNLNVSGEFFVSLAYKPLLSDNQPVAVYEIDHFMQWGTPEDVAEYQTWSKAFRHLSEPTTTSFLPTGSMVLPMAGLGQRFAEAGISAP